MWLPTLQKHRTPHTGPVPCFGLGGLNYQYQVQLAKEYSYHKAQTPVHQQLTV